MDKVDLILYIVCFASVLFSLYCLNQIDNVEDNCRAELARIINNSAYDPNRYGLDNIYIIPINLSGVE